MSEQEHHQHPVLRLRAVDAPDHPGRVNLGRKTSRLPEGFVMLMDAASGTPHSLFNQFTLEMAVSGRSGILDWGNTQESYADDGANYIAYLHYKNKTLESGSFEDLQEYGRVLGEAISSHTGRPYADSSRSRRTGTVISFYEWAHQNGLLPRVIPQREGTKRPAGLKVKPTRSLSHESVRQLMPRRPKPDEKINPIPIKIVKKALYNLGPKIADWVPHGRSCRDRLVAESGLATAARIVSLANIDVIDVLNAERLIDEDDPNQMFTISIVTKGEAPPTIIVPQKLLKKWLRYYYGERSEICRHVFAKFGGSRSVSSKLFLNLLTSNDRDLGAGASEDTLSRAFTRAMFAIGHTRLERRAAVDETGLPRRDTKKEVIWELHEVAANTFHDLRHTYVIFTYHAMKRAGDPNPWRVIKTALGHALISTTIDTYGRHVDIDESRLADAVDAVMSGFDAWED